MRQGAEASLNQFFLLLPSAYSQSSPILKNENIFRFNATMLAQSPLPCFSALSLARL